MNRVVIDKRSLVASIPLFSQLGDAELDALLAISLPRSLEPREVLFRKGDPGTELYGILSGRLRATTPSAHGKEVTFSVMGPGEVCGEIALLDGRPRSATIEAVEASHLIEIHRDDFLAYLERLPGLGVKLLAVLAERVRRVSSLVEDLVFMGVPSRLARRLLALARLFGRPLPGGEGVRIEMKLSPQDLGDLIGSPGESVDRQLRIWVSQDVLSILGDEITIRKREQLESLSALHQV